MKSITIGNSVKTIGEYAFQGCTSLSSITIPNSVTSIEKNAFGGCENLQSITIGNSVTSIGEYAFYGCKNLQSITLPNSVTTIGQYIFADCESLASVVLGNSLTTISERAFVDCHNLTYVTFGESITNIEESAFSFCYNLRSITIPNSATDIGEYAFYGCINLTEVIIGNSVTNIGLGAFMNCPNLTYVTLGQSVKQIGVMAFYDKSSCLTSISIPSSVTYIDEYAFPPSLTSIFVNRDQPQTIHSSAFADVDYNKCILYVPKGTSSLYKSAQYWEYFVNIVEYVSEPSLKIKHNGTEITEIKMECGKTLTTKIPDGCSSVLFNGADVTSQVTNGNYTTPAITLDSELTISFGEIKEDVNEDGQVNSLDVLKVYKYMQSH